ncbi:MAG: hypothetical protein J6D06_11350 [Clostridia bacterium]|nr:hypothetical protein [Clostridia bacterium]
MKKISLILALVLILNVFSCVVVSAEDVGDFARATAATSRTVHLTGISNATGGIYVKWNVISGATGYRVYKRGAGENTWTYLTTVNTTSYTDNRVVSGNYYRYTVRATFTNGYGGYESGLYIKRLVNPYSIKATNDAFGVTVTWGKVNGASSYYVYRRASGQTSWTRVASVTATSFADKNVVNGVYYKYTVRAVSGSTLSYFYDGSLVKCVAAPKVSKLTAGTNSVTVTWNAVSGANSYRVYRRSAGQTSWTYLATVTATGYVDTKVVKNNYYRYTVRAQSGNYMSGFFADGPVVKFTGSEGGSQQMTSEQILNLYKNAVSGVKVNGKAGYTKKSWESINNVYVSNPSLSSIYEDLLMDFVTTEADAESYVFAKGTQDAKDAFPGCGATLSQIKNITCTESGGNYVVKIQMKSQTNPRRTDTSGVATMSGNVLYYEDLRDSFNDPEISSLINRINTCSVTYEDFVIEAKITKDGKFISVSEYAKTDTKVGLNMVSIGNLDTEINMNLYTSYTNFKY